MAHQWAVMRGCTCFVAVELMRQGLKPGQAAEEAVRRTHRIGTEEVVR